MTKRFQNNFIGSQIIKLDQVDSTNNYALDIAQKTAPPNGTIVITDNQSSGKGQRGSSWESDQGKNLTFSLIFFPKNITTDNQFLLSQSIALGLSDFFEAYDLIPKVKWPNDIFIGKNKISGILIENVLKRHTINTSVVGIGININQTIFRGQFNATSLSIEKKELFDLQKIIPDLFGALEKRYLMLENNHFEKIENDYLSKMLQYNTWNNYQIHDTIIEGKITGVKKSGELQLMHKNGYTLNYQPKEIKFIL